MCEMCARNTFRAEYSVLANFPAKDAAPDLVQGQEWSEGDTAELSALLAEYESLRNESLNAINNRLHPPGRTEDIGTSPSVSQNSRKTGSERRGDHGAGGAPALWPAISSWGTAVITESVSAWGRS